MIEGFTLLADPLEWQDDDCVKHKEALITVV